MSKKNNNLFLKDQPFIIDNHNSIIFDKHLSVANDDSSNFFRNSNENSDVNLNQINKYSITIPFQSQNKKSSNNKFSVEKVPVDVGLVVAKAYSIASDNCKKNEKLQKWNKSSITDSIPAHQKDTKNYWKKDNSFLNSNKSSSILSLHISTYENSVASDKNNISKTKNLIKNQLSNSSSKFVIQNPFEFLRQQNDDEIRGPELSEFKASQHLFNTNLVSLNYGRQVENPGRCEPSTKKAVYQLAFPKGTCVLRFSDLTTENITNTIWIIENHILIRKLELEGPLIIGKPTYFRFTNRYQGWFYDEPWEFMPLTAVNNSTKSVDGFLAILFPTTEMIEKGFEVAERQRHSTPTSDISSRIQLEQKVQQLKAIKSRRKKVKNDANENGVEMKAEEEDDEFHEFGDDEESHDPHDIEMYDVDDI